jgi:hypothetical protein
LCFIVGHGCDFVKVMKWYEDDEYLFCLVIRYAEIVCHC